MPYRTLPQRESNPARLGAVARVLGVDAPSVGACSVLEIGCGTGGNLIPLAARYPESRFVGIDLSGRQIQEALLRVQELGLNNITFQHVDVSDYSHKPGAFDYILCHGVYSWVPEDVQQRILGLMVEALSTQGVAYISYNVLPGWYQRGALRDILTFGSSLVGSAHSETRVRKALEFLEVVASSRSGEQDLYGAYLHDALRRLRDSDISYIAHEYLEEHNNPCTFSQFMTKATAVGLQFLSESRPVFSSINDISTASQGVLTEIGDDLVAREQALDLFRNRSFRETLLCHSHHTLKRDLRASALRDVVAVADYIPFASAGPPAYAGAKRFKEVASGREISLPSGLYADVLTKIASYHAAGIRVGSLVDQFTTSEAELLAAAAMLWSSGFITLEQLPIPAATSLDGAPHLSHVARFQRDRGESIVTLRHQAFSPSVSEAELLKRIDGAKTFAEVIAGHDDPLAAKAILQAMLECGIFLA
jgi:SAM-dependent methyltransferase